jgi:hypothetical protein
MRRNYVVTRPEFKKMLDPETRDHASYHKMHIEILVIRRAEHMIQIDIPRIRDNRFHRRFLQSSSSSHNAPY